MKILYIHQYFKIPSQPGGTRSYWISQELLKQGHEVTMITSNPKGGEKREEKVIDGIKVIYLKEVYNQDMSIKQRLLSFVGFVRKSIKEAKKHKDVDLVIATSTPLTVGITALYLKWFRKKPYIFEVRDLWPEVPIQMGAFKSPLIVKPLRWFEKKIYQSAEHVVALSPGMQTGVLRYITSERTSMIPNMSKIEEFWPREKNMELMSRLELKKDSFKVIHFGALGLTNGAHTIIESAKLLKDNHSIVFMFAGGGSQEPKLAAIVKKYNLTNVRFFGRFPMQQMSEIVNFSDVSMVSFKDLPILYTNSPNKLFDSLSAGKPIIVNSAGWTKDIVEKNNCGFYVNPNKPQELVDKIKFLQANPDKAKEMGENSRRLAETTYDKSHLCLQFAKEVAKIEREMKSGVSSL